MRVSPWARKSKAELEPEEKAQSRLLVAPKSALMAELVTVSMACRSALERGLVRLKVLLGVITTAATEALTVLERSRSTSDRVPLAVRRESDSVMAAAALSRAIREMEGASLVPVMVIVMSWLLRAAPSPWDAVAIPLSSRMVMR